MRIEHRLFAWGICFITLGAIQLAVRTGLVDTSVFAGAWRLWPLLIVGAGVGILLRGTRIAIVGGLIVALTFGVIGGGLLAGGSFDIGSIACGSPATSGPTLTRSGTFDMTATVELDMRCGDLTIGTAPGSIWTAAVSAPEDHEPDISAGPARLTIESTGDRVSVPGFGVDRDTWDVILPQATTIDLSARVNAGNGRFDLRSARLGSVDLTVNAGSTRLDFEDARLADLGVTVNAGEVRIVLPAASFAGSLTVNAGSISICTTPDAALRITTREHFAAAYDFAGAGLIKDGSTWTSPTYSNAAVRIDLSATANAGSISLNPKDGCR